LKNVLCIINGCKRRATNITTKSLKNKFFTKKTFNEHRNFICNYHSNDIADDNGQCYKNTICVIKGCTNKANNRRTDSLKMYFETKNNIKEFKNFICNYHYYSDNYKFKRFIKKEINI